MLIKIKYEDGHLHFESDGDTLSTLIENLDELFISNKSISFHYGDVDCSLQLTVNGFACYFTRESFTTSFTCDDVHIVIDSESIDVYGHRNSDCTVHIVCVNG